MKVTRREFNRLVALSVGTLLPAIPAMAEDRKIGYCIVGLGRIGGEVARLERISVSWPHKGVSSPAKAAMTVQSR